MCGAAAKVSPCHSTFLFFLILLWWWWCWLANCAAAPAAKVENETKSMTHLTLTAFSCSSVSNIIYREAKAALFFLLDFDPLFFIGQQNLTICGEEKREGLCR